MGYIVVHMLFYRKQFSIKSPTNIAVTFNKETETELQVILVRL